MLNFYEIELTVIPDDLVGNNLFHKGSFFVIPIKSLGITDEDGKAEMWSKVYGHLKDNVDVSNLKDEYKGSLDEVDDKMQYDEDWEEDWDEEE